MLYANVYRGENVVWFFFHFDFFALKPRFYGRTQNFSWLPDYDDTIIHSVHVLNRGSFKITTATEATTKPSRKKVNKWTRKYIKLMKRLLEYRNFCCPSRVQIPRTEFKSWPCVFFFCIMKLLNTYTNWKWPQRLFSFISFLFCLSTFSVNGLYKLSFIYLYIYISYRHIPDYFSCILCP